MTAGFLASGVCALSCLVPAAAMADPPATKEVRLILQITVDGLRADLIDRYGDRFGKDGFRYLLDNGAVFTNAHYQHANTETIVGHATLATGALPSLHGMIGNVWYDRESGELAYNVEDARYPLIPTREEAIKGEQVDPAQQLARTQGRSPRSLLAETLGDKLKAYYGGRAKIFGVSGKDRSAIAMAGQTGNAFWISTDNGDFVTSKYYYDAYPDWVTAWNSGRKAEAHAGTEWKLLREQSTYLLGHQDDREYEVDLRGYGRVFPHRFGAADNNLLYTQIIVSPVGDRLTLDFAKALVESEHLGADGIPDYLSISFSSVDAVNHFFGPSSLENEDVVLQLDRTLADLFQFIDKQVGLGRTFIVLSADHGMAEMPEYMTELGFAAGRIYPETIVAAANAAGRELLGIDEIVRFYFRPYLYLDPGKVSAAGVTHAEAESAIAAALTDLAGITVAVPRSGLDALETSPLVQQIRRNQHPTRSGDIYVLQDPYWFNYAKGPIAAMHGSAWRYDTHVPIVFAGPGVPARKVHRRVHPVDVAPTLAALLGMTPPGSAQGATLPEVFE